MSVNKVYSLERRSSLSSPDEGARHLDLRQGGRTVAVCRHCLVPNCLCDFTGLGKPLVKLREYREGNKNQLYRTA